MKLVVVLCSLSVAAMCFMVYQAVRQELKIYHLKSRMLMNVVEVRKKEESIIELQTKIKDMKATALSVNTNIDELKKKKEESNKLKVDSADGLQKCNKEMVRDIIYQLFMHYINTIIDWKAVDKHFCLLSGRLSEEEGGKGSGHR